MYGLHENANVTKDNQETQQLLEGILLTQPRAASVGSRTSSEVVDLLAQDLLKKLPPDFDEPKVILKPYIKYLFVAFGSL